MGKKRGGEAGTNPSRWEREDEFGQANVTGRVVSTQVQAPKMARFIYVYGEREGLKQELLMILLLLPKAENMVRNNDPIITAHETSACEAKKKAAEHPYMYGQERSLRAAEMCLGPRYPV